MDESAASAVPHGIELCPSSSLQERGRAHVWDVLRRGEPVTAFVMRIDGRVVAYVNRCMHVDAEMDWNPGEFLDAERRYIICSLHGAIYEPATGRCARGPCGRLALTPVHVAEQDGMVAWYPSDDIQPLIF